MSFYLDTSVIVSTIVDDVHSGRAEQWLSGQSSANLVVSQWTAPEVSSALAIRLRRNVLSDAGHGRALAAWQQLYRDTFTILAVEPANLARATSLVDRIEWGLRAPDALHLAIAEAAGATMATFDDRLADACRTMGINVAAI